MFAVLHLSEFALQAVLRLEPERPNAPVALLASGPRAVLAECTDSARAAGVVAGLTVPQALARCPRLVVRAPQPAAETDARAALLAAAFTLSPVVEATAPGVCTMDLTGLAAAEREPALSGALDRLAATGLTATGGIAATPLLALYAAQWWSATSGRAGQSPSSDLNAVRAESTPGGRAPSRSIHPRLLIVQEGRSFLAPLPLAAADPSPAIAAIAGGWGIRTLGEFAALPKADIAQRLGLEGLALWDRCVGETHRPLQQAVAAPTFAAALDCEHELETVELLLFILRRLVDRLALELESAALAAAALELRLILSDETVHAHSIRLPQPSTSADVLFRALSTYLDALRTAAAIVGVRLSLEPTRISRRQQGLFDCALRDPPGFAETLARAAALVGPDRVGTPRIGNTHRPDSVQLTAPPEVIAPLAPSFALSPLGLVLRRYRPPLPATVRLAGRFPAYLWTDSVQGPVREQAGPWYGSGTWWEAEQLWEREEWDVELESGGVYRLVRTPGGWLLEGEYD
jgi:protein ImuB